MVEELGQIGEWQGGKPEGGIYPVKNGWSVRIRTGKPDHHNKNFNALSYGGRDEAYEEAKKYQLKHVLDHELGMKNRWRRCVSPEGEEFLQVQLQEGEDRFLVCDSTDLPLVETHVWYSWTGKNKRTSYAATTIHRSMRFFHNIKRPQWPLVDHRSRNGLDNQDTNIRDGSGGTNQRNNAKSSDNSSRVTGVCYHRRDKGWRASLMHNGKLYQKFFPGPHDNTSEAFHAACTWRRELAESVGNTNGLDMEQQ